MANLLNNTDLKEFLNCLDEDDIIKLAITTTHKLIKQEEIQNRSGVYLFNCHFTTNVIF